MSDIYGRTEYVKIYTPIKVISTEALFKLIVERLGNDLVFSGTHENDATLVVVGIRDKDTNVIMKVEGVEQGTPPRS